MPIRSPSPEVAQGLRPRWHMYTSRVGEPVAMQELAEAICAPDANGDPPSTDLKRLRVAEWQQLVRALKNGSLRRRQWNPAGRHPFVWELKLVWDGNLIRIYFSEPQSPANLTVGLLAHIKVIAGEETNQLQSAKIQEATDRFNLGVDW